MQSMKLLASAALAWGVLIGSVSGQDNCNAPGTLMVNVPQGFDLSAATSEGVPVCAMGNSENDVWFSFTAPVNDCYQIGIGATESAGVDQSVMNVTVYCYTDPGGGACPTAGDLIGCQDGSLQANLTAGTSYLVRLAMASNLVSVIDSGLVCVQGAEMAGTSAIDVTFSTMTVVEGGVFTATITPNLIEAVSALDFGLSYDDTKMMVTGLSTSGGVILPVQANWTGESPLINLITVGDDNLNNPSVLYGLTVFTAGGAHALPTELNTLTIEFTLLPAALDGDVLSFVLGAGSTQPNINGVGSCAMSLGPAEIVATPNLQVSVIQAPMCLPPANLTATTGLGGVTLAWDANMDHTDFVIERNGVQIATPGMGTTMFVDPTPEPGINDYTVTAMCGGDMASAMVMSGQVAIYSAGTDADPMTGLPVFLEFVDGTVSGGTFGLRHNSMNLTPTGHTQSTALMMLNGNTGPEFEDFQIDGTEGVTYGFVTDFGADMVAPDVLNPAGPIELIRVQYSVPLGATPGSEPVMFAGDLTPGMTPLAIPVAVTFTPTAGTATQLPATAIDGTVLIAGFFIRGDINGDDLVQLVDAIRLLEVLFLMGVNPMCDDALDANDDGSVGIVDAIVILQYLFGGGAAPAAPFPDCGLDPTPDILDCIVDTGTC